MTYADALEDCSSQMVGEMQAQIDDFSDDVEDAMAKYPHVARQLRADMEVLRGQLASAIDQRRADWLAEASVVTVCPHDPAHPLGTCPTMTR